MNTVGRQWIPSIFPENLFWEKLAVWTNFGQNYTTLYLIISSKDLFDMLQYDRAQQVNKIDNSQFFEKITF